MGQQSVFSWTIHIIIVILFYWQSWALIQNKSLLFKCLGSVRFFLKEINTFIQQRCIKLIKSHSKGISEGLCDNEDWINGC